MNWLEKFITSFGEDSGGYIYRDQRDVYNDIQNNSKNRNSPGNSIDQSVKNHGVSLEEQHREEGEDKETGEKFSIDVKNYNFKPSKKSNEKEKEWAEKEMIITITSLDDDTKLINSKIENLCGGRYAYLKDLPLPDVAAVLVADQRKIFGYIEASIANYAPAIDANHAMRVIKSASFKNIVSHIDYEKIKSKLQGESAREFDNLLAKTNIKIAYPLDSSIKPKQADRIDYFYRYIKDFSEYKTGNLNGLKKRAATVLSGLKLEEKSRLLKVMSKDKVMKDIKF